MGLGPMSNVAIERTFESEHSGHKSDDDSGRYFASVMSTIVSGVLVVLRPKLLTAYQISKYSK